MSNASVSSTSCGDKDKMTVASRQCLNMWISLVAKIGDTLRCDVIEMQAFLSMLNATIHLPSRPHRYLTCPCTRVPSSHMPPGLLHAPLVLLPSHIHTEALIALQRNAMSEVLLTSSCHAIKQTSATSKTKQVQHVRHV